MYDLYCGKCRTMKPADEFPANRGRSNDRFPGYCKECRREYQVGYRAEHARDLAKEYQQEKARKANWRDSSW